MYPKPGDNGGFKLTESLTCKNDQTLALAAKAVVEASGTMGSAITVRSQGSFQIRVVVYVLTVQTPRQPLSAVNVHIKE